MHVIDTIFIDSWINKCIFLGSQSYILMALIIFIFYELRYAVLYSDFKFLDGVEHLEVSNIW